ncbi:hypothetical protein lerEdw1_007462, partial [Lerista edwardsae]
IERNGILFRTPLHLACANGWTNVVTFLVDNRCKLNICDNDNRSPLMKAVQCQQELCAIYLLEHGADPNLVDASGNTALHLAASTSCISLAQQLLEHDARIDAQNKDGSTPLIVAVTENNKEMLEFLLQNGANLHARDNAGRTPLLTAASYGKHDLVKILLQSGADISHRDYSGWSAEDYADISGDPTLGQKIIEYANWQNTEKSSPDNKKDMTVFSSPGKSGDVGFTLGAPATNKEEMQQSLNQIAGDSVKVVDDLSSGDSLRNSGKIDDDSWLSSEEEELDFSPKKLQKPSLVQIMNVAPHFKKKVDEKSSVIRTQHIASSQLNKTDCEVEDLNESLPKSLSQVKSFPHPVQSSPGSFSKYSQMTSPHLRYNQSSKGNSKIGAEKNINPNEQEDPNDSLTSSEEEEFEEEGDEEEEDDYDDDEEEEEQEEEEEEEEGEEEEDFSQEREGDNIEEGSSNKMENGEKEYVKKSDEREKLSETVADNECRETHADQRLVSSNNEICKAQDEELQKAGDMPVSLTAEHYECLDENPAIYIANNELSNHSFENCHEHGNVNAFQNPNELKGTEENKITPKNHESFQVCSSETLKVTTLPVAFSSPLKNPKNNTGRNSNLGDTFESDDNSGSEIEFEKYKTKAQNPIFVDYRNIREKQYMDSRELETATCEPLGQESENSEEENLKEVFQTNIKAESSEESDDEEEDGETGEVSGILDKNVAYNGNSRHLFDDEGVIRKDTLALGMCEEEVKSAESPWDSECTSESPEKPIIGFLPTSPAKASTHMCSISEEPGKSDGSQLKTTKTNLEHGISASHLLKGTETREKTKSDLMEELGLDDADDIEDASDWDSTSVSLKSIPSNKSFHVLAMKDHVSPLQLAKSDAITETSETIPGEAEKSLGAHTITASTDPVCNEEVIQKVDSGENEDKNVIDIPNTIEKRSPENQTDKAEISFTCDKKKINAEILNEDSNYDHSQFDSALWEERYEKMWVANEKREVKTSFKSITAELKQMFGEINVDEKISNILVEGRSQDGFTGVLKSTNESPSPQLSKTTIGIQEKSDFGGLKPVIAEKECSAENLILCLQNPASQKVHFKLSEHEKQNVEQNWNANDEILSHSAEIPKINIREEEHGNTFVQLETDVSRKATPAEKCPDYSPAHSCKDIVSGTIFKSTCIKRPIVIDNTNLLFDVAGNTAQETRSHFNHGVFRDSTDSAYKNNETKIANKVKHCAQSCYQISKKELDEELERDVARFKNEIDEKKKQKWEKKKAAEKRQAADTEKELTINPVEKRMEQMLTVNEKQHIVTEGEMVEDNQVNVTSLVERTGLSLVPLKRTNLVVDEGKSENKRQISKQRASWHFTEKVHQLPDESSLSEASLEEDGNPTKIVNGKNKICRSSDLDDLTQSSDTATEDIELPKSVYREAVALIDQLSLNSTDSVSLLKIQNIFHGYERLIEHEKRRYAQLLGKVKKLENEKKEQQRMLEETRELKSVLDHQKVERESDISDLKFSLKQEEEKRMSAEILYEKNQEQLRKKEEQYCKQMEEKQQLELMLRTLEMEIRTLKTHLKEVEEERNESQRQLTQEQNARALQEGILNTHFWRQKELEESKRKLSRSSEMADGHDQELLHKNKILQDELSVLRLELDQLRVQHQEAAARYSEENEALKEKTEELKKELKMNEEALTQTVFQYNGQINVSKAESAMLTSKFEHMKESKERLEVELDSVRSRMNSALQELERGQLSKTDLERTVQRERDEWLRLKDRLNHDLCNLRETNNAMSQQLSKAESKANGLENELHHVTHTLREKNLLLESVQRDLSQAQCQVKELENARQAEKDQMNKYVVKQDSMQERLAQLQSENLLLRQQFEDFQNKGIIKEKIVTDVQDRFHDMFSKLRADTEKQVEMMEERNKELITTCNNLREQVFKYETEKVEREGILRQLQQELADSLKKQSMSEASLEVTTRYRNDLEEDKQQLQKEIDRIKCKLQETEEQHIHSERRTYDLRSALDAKEHEASMASQKLQDLLEASSGTNNAVKQLEEHIQRLEIENARLEATAKQQTGRIEILQKDLQSSAFVHNRLEELITGLQTAKINLEEQLSHQVQKQNMLSVTAQDTHNMWEEELKSRSKLGVRLSELDREKVEVTAQLEYERKKVKKLMELKRSVEMRLDQEMKRNGELQKEYNAIKKLLRTTKKKLKESRDSSPPTSFNKEIKNRYSEIDTEVGELSHQLETESARCTRLESANCDLREQLSSMKLLHRNHEKLEKSKLQLEEDVANLKRHVHGTLMDHSQIEQYKRDIEERARQEIRQKLEEVNLFLQRQAASQETLEQIRATNDTSLRNQLEHRIRDLESELARLKSNQQDSIFQNESSYMELERYKGLYAEELKRRKSLESKLDRLLQTSYPTFYRANEKLAEANAKLLHERQRSSSLLASSFVNGSLSASPVLETVQFGNLGTNLALNRTLNLGGGFINPNRTTLSSKDSVEAYLAKMRVELEKSITKELEQATAELDAGSVRVSPIGSIDGSSKNLNMDQDQVSKAKQEYLDVLKKNYML